MNCSALIPSCSFPVPCLDTLFPMCAVNWQESGDRQCDSREGRGGSSLQRLAKRSLKESEVRSREVSYTAMNEGEGSINETRKERRGQAIQHLSLLLFSRKVVFQPFATPWTAAHQATLFFTISRSLLRFMSIESVMLSNHLTLCRPLLLQPAIFPSIRVFFNESALGIK